MGTSTQQYYHNNLYIYASSGTVCDDDDFDNHGQSECNTDIYSGCTDLFGGNFVSAANYFKQWRYGYVGTCIEQYCHHYLYIYTSSGTVCDDDDFDYYC